MPQFSRSIRAWSGLGLVLASLPLASCGPKRLTVLGPLQNAEVSARAAEEGTRLEGAVRIDFTWELNESGSRVDGVGVARIDSPYRARLDLFLDNGESVITAALVDDDLRLPYGAPDDVLPPVDLMWGTLGVFRPIGGTRLAGGDRLEGRSERLRYVYADGTELHYEVRGDTVRGLELVEGTSVVQWVRLEPDEGSRFPKRATYRNLAEFRELKITRSAVTAAGPFDPSIWDPRE